MDKEKGITKEENIYIAGDCVYGPDSVVEAIASGRKVADLISG